VTMRKNVGSVALVPLEDLTEAFERRENWGQS